ncbi:MAG: roadblock/LC7 domain-containing protein, partial [Candidatus Electrothrix sp. AR3]|nr:roadblock/LC7 domain-containing protein [Candidatus Electrothrix sp. AR3]
MDVQKKLSRLAEIEGFIGTALFSPEGRLLAKCEPFDLDLKLIGSLANNVLINIHKASCDMGFGHTPFTYIHTERALILLRCLNEGNNPLHAQPGKCHIHLVLLLDNPDSFGIAKLEINRVIESLADDFRIHPVDSKSTSTGKTTAANNNKKVSKEQEIQNVVKSLDD